eukprot:6214277-Pleurochrysis_carterae.AAC.2
MRARACVCLVRVCVCACALARTYARVRACVRVRVRVFACVRVFTCVRACVRASVNVHVRVHVRVSVSACAACRGGARHRLDADESLHRLSANARARSAVEADTSKVTLYENHVESYTRFARESENHFKPPPAVRFSAHRLSFLQCAASTPSRRK